jgi:hypothetical protein
LDRASTNPGRSVPMTVTTRVEVMLGYPFVMP